MQRKELPERDMSISELLHAARKERNKIPFKKADRKIAQKLILEPIQKV